MSQTSQKPYWLQGNLAPVAEETTVFDLPVEGAIPPSLRGLYARNGPNPHQGLSNHWFLGDGMLHGVRLQDGTAKWYRNRWVRTPRLADQQFASPIDLHNAASNTNIVAHAGAMLALVENALPMRIGRELETLGFDDFGGKLKTPFTAHPKTCPRTGELHFFGYRPMPPFLTYHVADTSGSLVRSLEIPVDAPTMMHDFALTRGHVIFMDLPVVFDMALAMRGTLPYSWRESRPARLGVLGRGADISTLRWVEIDPCYVFHVGNAFEDDDGAIVLYVAWYHELWRGGPSEHAFETARLKRWRIPVGASRATEEFIDDRAVEFPRINEDMTGNRHGFVYAVQGDADIVSGSNSVFKYDARTGKRTAHVFEAGMPSEFVFAPAADGRNEDEGWLIGFVYDRASNKSDLVILDAQTIEAKPVARIRLPRRVPQGFHGNWMPDDERRARSS